MNRLVDQFLKLRCATDVLEAVHPLNSAVKEISESMSLIQAIRSPILNNPGRWRVIDLCAGNALTGVIAAHLLPVRHVVAIDKYPRERQYYRVNQFEYVQDDIHRVELWDNLATSPLTMIVASHACKDLAITIAQKCRDYDLAMAMLTCCQSQGRLSPTFRSMVPVMGKYKAWTAFVAHCAEGRFRFVEDCISPCNGLVTRKI